MSPHDLRYWRELQGISQAGLAAMLGRAWITVSKWENGKNAIPDWLPDWLEYLESEVGRGNGVPTCPSRVEDVRCILYQEARLAREAKQAVSARRKAAGAVRAQQRLERDVRAAERIRKARKAEILQRRLALIKEKL